MDIKTEIELRARLLDLRKEASQLVYLSCPSRRLRRRKADLSDEIALVKLDLKAASITEASQIKTKEDSGNGSRKKRGR